MGQWSNRGPKQTNKHHDTKIKNKQKTRNLTHNLCNKVIRSISDLEKRVIKIDERIRNLERKHQKQGGRGQIHQGNWGAGKESSRNERINQSNDKHQKALLETSPNRKWNARDRGQSQSNSILIYIYWTWLKLLWSLGSTQTITPKSPQGRSIWDKSQVTSTV